MPKVVFLSKDLWGFGKSHGRGFPPGFVARVLRELYHGGRLLHLCCGAARVPGAVNVDIRPQVRPDLVADACQLPFKDGSFAFVLADPPYETHDSRVRYNTEQPPLYRLLAEMSRVTAPGGQYALLYPFTPATLAGDAKAREIVLTLGVHKRPRVLSIFLRGMMPGLLPRQYLPCRHASTLRASSS